MWGERLRQKQWLGILSAFSGLVLAATVVIRNTKLGEVSAAKVLFYSLTVAAAVAFVSFLTWVWLLRRCIASRFSVFSFLAPNDFKDSQFYKLIISVLA